MAWSNKGRLWTWGRGADLCLGHGDNKDVDVPKELILPHVAPPAPPAAPVEGVPMLDLKAPPRVLDAACGACHSLVATSSGLFVWGKGASGVLGLGDELDCPAPKLVTAFGERSMQVVRVAAGGCHSVALIEMPRPGNLTER
jgi:alpha-tubulin suppressor-like RCC1 family protein